MDVVEIEVLPTTSAHPTCDEARTNRTSCVIFVPLSGLWVERPVRRVRDGDLKIPDAGENPMLRAVVRSTYV